MRSAVKKPTIKDNRTNIPQDRIVLQHQANDQRQQRSQTITKNRLVSRFGVRSNNDSSIKPKHTHLPVRPAPSAGVLRQAKTKHDPIKASLEKATAHQAPKLKKPGRRQRVATKLHISTRRLNIGLSILAGILLISFIAQQNMYSLEMRVAATRAGVAANLPAYTPSGFSMSGPIAYRPGQITISYKSNSDNRSFNVRQTLSSWDSQTLLDNFVASSQRQYQTYQDNGKTIYIYDGSNATWVDQGIWYQIEGKSSLNSDQLLRLANSI
jgi:hypothetical protein